MNEEQDIYNEYQVPLDIYADEYNTQKQDIKSIINYFFINGSYLETSYSTLNEALDIGFVSDFLVDTFMKLRHKDNEIVMLERYYEILIYMSQFDSSLFPTSSSYLYDILTEKEKIFEKVDENSETNKTTDFISLSKEILERIDRSQSTQYWPEFSEVIIFADKERSNTTSLRDEDYTDITKFFKSNVDRLKKINPGFNNSFRSDIELLINNHALNQKFDSILENMKDSSDNKDDDKTLFKIFEVEDLNEVKDNPQAEKLLAKNNYRSLHSVEPFLSSLEQLRHDFPNMEDFIDSVEENAVLNRLGNGAFYIPPSLLVGPPGIGKTFFLSVLLEKAQIHKTMIHMEALSGSWMLTGASPQWKEAKPGVIFNTLIEKDHANNAIILDEIDKINKGTYSPEHSLLQVFEEHTAKEFKDEFCPIKLNISHMIWLATANEIRNISEPMLSRFNTYNIKMPTLAERKILAVNIYKSLLSTKTWGHVFSDSISDVVLDKICESDSSIRTMKKDLLSACGQAAKKGRTVLHIEDFTKSTGASKFVIGFK